MHPDHVARIVGYLQDGTHVHITGLRGSGRSAVLGQVTDRLAGLGISVVAVRGMRALRDRPLGALAVAGVPVASTPQPLTMLTSAVDGLAGLLASPASALLVDDADELDATSMAAILAVQARLRTRVVTAGRPDHAPATLTDELRPAARVDLGPLPFDGVHRLLHSMLGRGVEPSAVARIASASGGLPGLVEALVDTARRENRLVLRDGLWVARGDLWTSPLSQTVEPFLTDLDDDAREALTLLAFAGTVSLETAGELVGVDRLTALDDAGLVQVVSDGDRTLVGVFPPVVGDYLVHETSVTRSLRATGRVAGIRAGQGSARMPVESRVVAPVVSRLFAAHWSERRTELMREWQADRTDPVPATELVEAMRLTHARPHEVSTVLEAAGLTEDQVDAPDAELARAREAEHLVATGRVGAALELLAGFHPARARARRVAGTAHGLALLYSCEVERSARLALAEVERARQELDPVALMAHSTVAGLALAVLGRAMELDRLVCDALSLPTACPQEPELVVGLVALAAEATTWQGRADFAASLGIQARSMDPRPGPHPYQATQLIGALIRDDDDPAVAAETAEEIWQVARERLDRGYLPAGILAGVLAVDRFPDTERAAVLVEAAERCPDAPLLRHLAEYATAVAAGCPERLAELEPVLRRAGLRQFAVRAAVARAVRLIAEGQPAAATERADTAWSQGGLRGRDLCGLFLPFDRAVRLTSREREVAVLVARGLSSPEIATRMVLSARTVEHHILSACRKVGVNSREGLAKAARTWLTCTIR
nr:LuxR family transcriptional regulator [Cellulomonas denverensis]